jgi:hypothetical protein
LITVIADNQRLVAASLVEADVARSFEARGPGAPFVRALSGLRLAEMSAHAAAVCDGRGCARVADAVLSSLGGLA